MKKIHSLHREFLNALQIPGDLAFQDSLVTCSGCREVTVENYRKILEYQTTGIRILLKHGQMRIQGERLCIVYYCRDEMKITGFIQGIFFE